MKKKIATILIVSLILSNNIYASVKGEDGSGFVTRGECIAYFDSVIKQLDEAEASIYQRVASRCEIYGIEKMKKGDE